MKKGKRKRKEKGERRKTAVANVRSMVRAGKNEFQQPKREILIKGQTITTQLY